MSNEMTGLGITLFFALIGFGMSVYNLYLNRKQASIYDIAIEQKESLVKIERTVRSINDMLGRGTP